MTAALPPAPSTELALRRVKWQVTGAPVVFKLHYQFGIKEDWNHPEGWYSVREGIYGDPGNWYIIAWPGCAYDGVTKYPDYDWLLPHAMRHDILHWLIKRGVIREKYNDVIDLELERSIVMGKEPIPWRQGGNSKLVRKIRAKFILRGTNLANERGSSAPDIKTKRLLI